MNDSSVSCMDCCQCKDWEDTDLKRPWSEWKFLILTVRFLGSRPIYLLILHLFYVAVNKSLQSFHGEHSGSKDGKKWPWILEGYQKEYNFITSSPVKIRIVRQGIECAENLVRKIKVLLYWLWREEKKWRKLLRGKGTALLCLFLAQYFRAK